MCAKIVQITVLTVLRKTHVTNVQRI